MGRYTGPKGKLSRREGINLFLKGSRDFSDKNAVARKPYPPGQHGNARRTRLSNYGVQLRQKQVVKRIYGVRERQLKNMYKKAVRISKTSGTDRGLEFLRLLETRLDNVVYMLGLAPSRASARQFVTHRHVTVNGKVLNIPSYHVEVGDVVELKENRKHLKPAEQLFDSPAWLVKDPLGGKVLDLPSRDDIDEGIQENLIIEFYSR